MTNPLDTCRNIDPEQLLRDIEANRRRLPKLGPPHWMAPGPCTACNAQYPACETCDRCKGDGCEPD